MKINNMLLYVIFVMMLNTTQVSTSLSYNNLAKYGIRFYSDEGSGWNARSNAAMIQYNSYQALLFITLWQFW